MTDDMGSIGARILGHAVKRPHDRAVVCDGEALDYAGLLTQARKTSARLSALGLSGGGARRVGVLGANSLDYAVVVVACQLEGVTVVPLPVLVTADAQARMLADADIAVLFHDAECAVAAQNALRLGTRDVVLVEIGPAFRADGSREHRLAAWSSKSVEASHTHDVHGSWISDLIYSSGTTGLPKGIAQSYAARRSQCITLAAMGVTDGVQLLHTVGLYSNYGFSALLLALWWGGAFFMQRKFSGPATVELLARELIDMAWFAPATLIRTLDAPGFGAAVAGKTCAKLSAGAPLSEAHKLQVLSAWPGAFFEVYGQTETGTLTMLPMHAVPPSKLSSVGVVLPSVQVRIITEAGTEVAPDEEGEIVGHSTTLMTGYHEREEANADAFWRDADGRLFIRTGDIGRIDREGYLWLCDRKKDMIISGGFNIYPADIERVFGEHPDVFESAVVGYPSDRWGESPVAFVKLRVTGAVGEDDLKAWVNARLGSVQRVVAVKVLDDLPSGAMGKILKRELRDQFAPEIGRLP